MLKRNPFPYIGKVMKHEIKSSYGSMFMLYGILAGLTLLTILFGPEGVLVRNQSFRYTPLFDFFSNILMVISGLAVFGIIIFCFNKIGNRFRKSMMQDEAYITHTLPVTTGELLWGKFFVSLMWLLLSVFIAWLSIKVIDYFETADIVHLLEDDEEFMTLAGEKSRKVLSEARIYGTVTALILGCWIITTMFLGTALRSVKKYLSVIFVIGTVTLCWILPSWFISTNLDGLSVIVSQERFTDVTRFIFNRLWIITGCFGLITAGNFALSHYIFKKHLNLQ